jgi:hypothetical protein
VNDFRLSWVQVRSNSYVLKFTHLGNELNLGWVAYAEGLFEWRGGIYGVDKSEITDASERVIKQVIHAACIRKMKSAIEEFQKATFRADFNAENE